MSIRTWFFGPGSRSRAFQNVPADHLRTEEGTFSGFHRFYSHGVTQLLCAVVLLAWLAAGYTHMG